MIKESDVRGAAAKYDAAAVLSLLAAGDWSQNDIETLAGHLLRSNSLVQKRVAGPGKNRRERFMRELIAATTDQAGPTLAAPLERANQYLEIAEEGYHRILNSLNASAYARLDGPARVAAVLGGAALHHRQVAADSMLALFADGMANPQGAVLRDGDGRPFSIDAMMDSIVGGAAATLLMEARNQGWLRDGVVTLPDLPEIGEEEIAAAGEAQYLALAWRLWRRLEERGRFQAGRLAVRCAPDLPASSPAGATRCLQLEGDVGAWDMFAAQTRLNDNAAQTAMEVMRLPKHELMIVDPIRGARLAPVQYVSNQEILGYAELHEMLGYPPEEEEGLVGGLTVVEWLRGLAIFGVAAERRFEETPADAPPGLIMIDEQHLLAVLRRNELSEAAAKRFISEATFREDSRDLFDAPLLQMQNGGKLLFGPAMLGFNPAGILRSVFSARGVQFEQKGRAFEERVIDLFRRKGLDARSFKAGRGGQEYEFDAVVLWGDYIFVFECKNRSLPGEEATQAYRFLEETLANAEQVRRLAKALGQWPELLTERFGEGAADKTVVPCILHNLPFARPGFADGCYHYDFTSLARFLETSHVNIKVSQPMGLGQAAATMAIPTIPLWKGSKPTAEDMIAEMNDPVALRVLRHHASPDFVTFLLDGETAALCPEFVLEPITPMTMGDVAGVPRRQIKLELDRVKRRLAKLKRKEAPRSSRPSAIGR